MAGFQVHRITNAAVYIDGNSFYGKASEIDLGTIKAVTSDFESLGMIGLIELPDGVDKLEGKVIWNSEYREVAQKVATPFISRQLQCRSSIDVHTSQGRVQELPMVTLMTVMFKEFQLGTYKPRTPTTYETPFSATYIRQLVNGRETVMFDYLANIYRVDSKDMMSKYRKNLGLS
ncbi:MULTISPECIES: phage major tail tube protein [Yersinia pseudotuberculosis complex]|uniref:phage major tail tube protein n=1 Tax=Yersinia pseudotuberculosis complex TaxID=1649845 RepID=UPI00061BB64F|nr:MULTISPECIES: phage major tail tube protein [Yersinia pseudotuberculosis complex]MBO1561852.1 phage major tail tube protein [Yersinia pseudotuberculosis]BCU88725.1 phage major tail tube protein [Yersinia pseudotuberculosis]CNC37408.1 major tail tube protein [Yersinia similis]CRY70826.1 major tail tube protein [Yersinia pseudotuberculosis]